MTKTIRVEPQSKLTLEEFLDHVGFATQFTEYDSLDPIAQPFRDLASNREMLPEILCNVAKGLAQGGRAGMYTSQSITLGHGNNYYVRANFWTPLKLEGSFKTQERKAFSYNDTHDHNYNFMTVGYFGPGYETDLYRYDPENVEGYVGESVNLEYVGRESLPVGKIMTYECKKDAHTQFPPDSLSISLNLIAHNRQFDQLDQYYFCPRQRKIIGIPQLAFVHRRASVISMLGQVANANGVDILCELSISSSCRRVREAAFEGLAVAPNLTTDERIELVQAGISDRDKIVSRHAREIIERLTAAAV